MYESTRIWRHIEQEERIPADALIIYIEKISQRLDIIIFVFLPEPSRTNRDVALGRDPCVASLCSLVKNPDPFRMSGKFIIDLHCAPACTSGTSPFISDPTAAGTIVTENHSIRLHTVYGRVEEWPVIDLFLAVRSFSAGSVKPLLEDRTVISQSMLQRLYIYIVVLVCTIMRIMSVPWRNINSEFNTIFPAGIGKFLQDITFAIFPAALGHGVSAVWIRPQAESVMMLTCNDDTFHTRRLGNGCPLTAIHSSRIEQFRLLLTASPLVTGECVRSEMHEHVKFHLLPLDLLLCRQHTVWSRFTDLDGSA